MKILLDTHIWLWYSLGNPKLSRNLQTIMSDPRNELWISPISIWEAILLVERGRIALSPEPISWIESSLQTLGVIEAQLNYSIAILSRQLPCPHQDPADRFIAATAVYYDLELATVDRNLIDTVSLRTIS